MASCLWLLVLAVSLYDCAAYSAEATPAPRPIAVEARHPLLHQRPMLLPWASVLFLLILASATLGRSRLALLGRRVCKQGKAPELCEDVDLEMVPSPTAARLGRGRRLQASKEASGAESQDRRATSNFSDNVKGPLRGLERRCSLGSVCTGGAAASPEVGQATENGGPGSAACTDSEKRLPRSHPSVKTLPEATAADSLLERCRNQSTAWPTCYQQGATQTSGPVVVQDPPRRPLDPSPAAATSRPLPPAPAPKNGPVSSEDRGYRATEVVWGYPRTRGQTRDGPPEPEVDSEVVALLPVHAASVQQRAAASNPATQSLRGGFWPSHNAAGLPILPTTGPRGLPSPLHGASSP